LHLDFVAKVKEKSGKETLIIIEIQKAKLPSDIKRFRRYLGEQYQNPNNITVDKNTSEKKANPILSIYFLGHKLEHITAPIIKVSREYIDLAKGEKIKEKEQFIESLTHDSFIIQIPFLKNNRRNSLEKVLSVFDQNNQTNDKHFLNIIEENYPKKYQSIIKRLMSALADSEMKKRMTVEDEYVEDLKDLERIAKEKTIEAEENARLAEANAKLAEKKAIEADENAKLVEEKENSIINSILEFHNLGLDLEKISNLTGKTVEEIKSLLDGKYCK
jgi:hypothetical protein